MPAPLSMRSLMVALLGLNHFGEPLFASSTQCPSFTVSASIVVASGAQSDDQQFRSNLYCPLPATLLEMQSAALIFCDGSAVIYASRSQYFVLNAVDSAAVKIDIGTPGARRYPSGTGISYAYSNTLLALLACSQQFSTSLL